MKSEKLSFREELKQQNFKTEHEEAEWWDRHQADVEKEFEKALADGTLGCATAVRRGSTPTTTIRLDPEDITKARVQAEQKGLRYQTYLKGLIHEALQLEDARQHSK